MTTPHLHSMLVALLAMAWTVAPLGARAQTPDGATPAEESVCDPLHDASPGLYGLCVSYCEAQDCDSIGDAIDDRCEVPSIHLLDIYDRIRTAADPPMPCLDAAPSPCSCFSEGDLADLQLAACLEFEATSFTSVAIVDVQERNGAMVDVGTGWGTCTLVVDGQATMYQIDEEEAIACEAILRDAADAQGLVCQ